MKLIVRFAAILLLGVFSLGCGKTQGPWKPFSATPVSRPREARPAAFAAQQSSPTAPATDHFEGEVRRGERFEKILGTRIVFRLEPYAGNDAGWTIRIAPDTDPTSEAVDCIGAVSVPLHGDNEVELQASEGTPKEEVELKRPREFTFVATPTNCKAAWDLMNLVNYGNKLSDKERADDDKRLAEIPTSQGKLSVVDLRFQAPAAPNAPRQLEWLKFRVELPIFIETGNSRPR